MSDEIKHAVHAVTFLAHAQERIEADDRLQASEKVWGAVAQTLKHIAEKHGWENESDRDLAQIAGYLAASTDNTSINALYGTARSHHTNFYEDEYLMEQIEAGRNSAEELIDLLLDADRRWAEGARPPNRATSPLDYAHRCRPTR